MKDISIWRWLVLVVVLSGCTTPRLQPALLENYEPALYRTHAVMADGYVLPLSTWQPETTPKAVVLALHGFNDYRNAFAPVGPVLIRHDIITYAYDQRGFGETQWPGLWAGIERMTEDLETMIALLHTKHTGLPLYLMGESMGGAVLMASLQQPQQPNYDGMILLAPAVRGRDSMNPPQRWALWLAAHTAPAKKVTGKGLDITASDNIEMLKAQGRDPLIIKVTRIDALYGMANLMDAALASAPQLTGPTLILHGVNDEFIPKRSTCRMLATLPENAALRVVIYPNGYHMLTRDLQADVVLQDIAAWIIDPSAALPSSPNSPIADLCLEN